MDPANRPLSLAELLLKFGIALERDDRVEAEESRRELAARFGVTVRLKGRGRRRGLAGPRRRTP